MKVKTASGTTGWALENDNFEGMDILAKFFGESEIRETTNAARHHSD